MTGLLFTVFNTADNTLGTIRYAATQLNPTPPVTGTGALVNILFRAKSSASTPLTFTLAQLADRSGQTIPATANTGSVAAEGPVMSTLAITKLTGTDARLSRTGAAGASEYRLYRATTPYFAPIDPPYTTTTNLSYDDAGVLGDPAVNYYYVVRAACANGFPSNNSNRVGEFDFAITRNAYNTIALPLIDPGLTTADQLGSLTGAEEVSQWVAGTQSFDTRIVGVLGNNFALSTGQGYFLNTPGGGPTIFTLVGRVPAPAAVSFSISRATPACLLNLLSLPLDQDSLGSAAHLNHVTGRRAGAWSQRKRLSAESLRGTGRYLHRHQQPGCQSRQRYVALAQRKQ